MYFRQQPVGTIVLNGMMLGEELGVTICGVKEELAGDWVYVEVHYRV